MNLQIAISLCERHTRHHDVRAALEYGDPNEKQPKAGILLANWNDCPKWLMNGLERRGFDLNWEDEYIECGETGKVYRSSPDCYSWTPYFVISEDGEVYGGDEIEDPKSGAQDWYVNEYLLNDPNHCNIFRGVSLADRGFSKFNGTYETGFHPGQNNDPRKVLAHINLALPDHDVVFEMAGKDQFDISWTAWTRPQSCQRGKDNGQHVQ